MTTPPRRSLRARLTQNQPLHTLSLQGMAQTPPCGVSCSTESKMGANQMADVPGVLLGSDRSRDA
jgi:hypothetical protein